MSEKKEACNSRQLCFEIGNWDIFGNVNRKCRLIFIKFYFQNLSLKKHNLADTTTTLSIIALHIISLFTFIFSITAIFNTQIFLPNGRHKNSWIKINYTRTNKKKMENTNHVFCVCMYVHKKLSKTNRIISAFSCRFCTDNTKSCSNPP